MCILYYYNSKIVDTAWAYSFYFYFYTDLMQPYFSIGAVATQEDAHVVEDDVDETKRHLNVVFIGHVGKFCFLTACFLNIFLLLPRLVLTEYLIDSCVFVDCDV